MSKVEQTTPSEWCKRQYDEAVEQGRTKDADAYQQLYETWKSRES